MPYLFREAPVTTATLPSKRILIHPVLLFGDILFESYVFEDRKLADSITGGPCIGTAGGWIRRFETGAVGSEEQR